MEIYEKIDYGLRFLLELDGNRITGRRTEWDHFHQVSETREYEFESAEKLLEDFWDGVTKLLERRFGGYV